VSSSEIGGSVTQDELLNIPTVNRDFGDYLDLLPGVVAGDFLGQDRAMYTIDGGSNNDMTRGGAQARVPIEAIQEFELIGNQADAAYGTGGAVVRVVSKSGTNQFHGSGLFHANDSSSREIDYFAKLEGDEKPD
jgi:outer membrane receptor protein involved in Fe transport